jgi:hypothetical protein
MDTRKMIQELLEEKRRLEQIITFLQALEHPLFDEQQAKPAKALRGRKSMSPVERQAVSERMRRYWATRKEQRRASCPGSAGA